MTHMTALDGTAASSLCFGTMQFGGSADARASKVMYDACRAADINFFDTAHVYTEGESETLLGTFIRHEREDILLATKAGYAGGAARKNILSTFDESRERMQVDMVDLFYMHRWDPHTPLEETFETLARMQDQGLIRYIGVSNYAAWQVVKANQVAAQFGTRIDVLQPMYSLVKRQAEVEILPACEDQGIGVCPYSPLGGGLLTGKYAEGATGRLTEDHRYAARYNVPWMHEAAAALPRLAQEYGTDPATLAVAWVAHHKAITAPIISARSEEQLRPSLAAMQFDMSDPLYEEITALSQTPAPATDRLEEA